MNQVEGSTNRRRFLKQTGATLAAGIGLSMVPSLSKAFASESGDSASPSLPNSKSVTCCTDTSNCGKCANNNKTQYYCTGQCPAFCYGCTTFRGQCFNESLPSCF